MKNYLIHLNKNIKDSLLQLEKNREKCLVVINSNNVLKGTLTDGDIRRAMLRGADANSKIRKYIKKNPFYLKSKNFANNTHNMKKVIYDASKKIKDEHIDMIPLIDGNRKVIEIGDAIISNQKIKKVLNWAPQKSLKSGLIKTKEYYTTCMEEYLK